LIALIKVMPCGLACPWSRIAESLLCEQLTIFAPLFLRRVRQSKSGWSWGCVATVDARGRTIFVADAHRGNGQRFVVRANEG
jgi:hypothetical protein